MLRFDLWRASFRALRHRNFRLYWTGQFVSLIGSWMQSIAQGWLMHRLTDSPFMLGLVMFLQFIPVLLFALPAGSLVDRVDKRRLLIVTQSAMLIQAVVLATLVSIGIVRPWMVLVLAFVYGCANAFDLPSRQTMVVDLTGKEDLSNGIALNSAAFNSARAIGPAIAGVLVAKVGEAGCFWINAASFLAVIASLVRLRLPAAPEARGAVRTSVRDGFAYLRANPSIRNLLVLLGATTMLGFQYGTLLPVYAQHRLSGGAETYGSLMSAFGIGSLASALWLTRPQERTTLRVNILVGLLITGLAMIVFAWSRRVDLSLAAGLMTGFGMILYISSVNMLVQLRVDDAFRGRVMGFYTWLFVGSAPFGALLVGAVAERWGAPLATTLGALSMLGGALWAALRLRAVRPGQVVRVA